MNKNIKIVGFTISLTWLAFITLAIFIKAVSVIFNDWFVNHSILIAVLSGIAVLIFIILGAISLGSLSSKGKGIFA